jgi:hypothetical protein
VGVAYSGSGAIETGCYAISEKHDTTAAAEASSDSIAFTWSDKRSKGAELKIAKIVGAGAATNDLHEGSILLRGLVIRSISNFYPVVGGQCGNQQDLLPVNPVITELIGATGMDVTVGDTSQYAAFMTVKGSIKKAAIDTLGAHVTDTSKYSIRISFNGPRWIGARYAGFQLDSIRTDSSSGFALGTSHEITPGYLITVTKAETGGYRALVRSSLGADASPTDTVIRHGEMFFFGFPKKATTGKRQYYRAWLYVDPSEQTVTKLRVEQVTFTLCEWKIQDDSANLANWVNTPSKRRQTPNERCQR